MLQKIRRLRCERRGFHRPQCRITEHPVVLLQEHIHTCVDCDTLLLAQLRKYDPTQVLITNSIMGMDEADQQAYMQ